MSSFSAHSRQDIIQQMRNQEYDLLVIGGGITGAGIALDAASRGLKVALIEKNDFGWGTSSRSTKLIHGGLRYLKQLEIALVREVGREREVLHRNAPHLVVPEKMLLPLVKEGTFGPFATSFGLWVYDFLAGVKEEEQRTMLSREQAIAQEPLMRQDILEGAGLYIEYRTDDARLTVEVLKTALAYGANALNYLKATGFVYNQAGKIEATYVRDQISGQEFTIRARRTVNAAGPWVDSVRGNDTTAPNTRKHLQLTKGVHLVVPRERLPIRQALYFDAPGGRMVFAIPRDKVTYIGTTDTTYHDNIDRPFTSLEDVEYILNAANYMFPAAGLVQQDIISSWAGLRPLIHEEGKGPSELSRKDEIFVSEGGLISIAGGKLTGFRKMAERVVDRVMQQLNRQYGTAERKCITDDITLSGGNFSAYESVNAFVEVLAEQIAPLGIGKEYARTLTFNFGTNALNIVHDIVQLAKTRNLHEACALAELRYCFQHEMVNNLNDFLIRRTGKLYFERPDIAPVLPVLAHELCQLLELPADYAKALIEDFELEYKQVITFRPEMEMA